MTNAYEYIKEVGGLMTAEEYPYKGYVGQCDPEKVLVQLEDFSVISLDEDQIAANLVKYGPLAGRSLFTIRSFGTLIIYTLLN